MENNEGVKPEETQVTPPENHDQRRSKELVEKLKAKDEELELERKARKEFESSTKDKISSLEFSASLAETAPHLMSKKTELNELKSKHPTLSTQELVQLYSAQNPEQVQTSGEIKHVSPAISPNGGTKAVTDMSDTELQEAANAEARALGWKI